MIYLLKISYKGGFLSLISKNSNYFPDEISELIDEKTDLDSTQDFDGTLDFEEESLNEEIMEELVDTIFDISGNELNDTKVLDQLKLLSDEEKALGQLNILADYEKEAIDEKLKNKMFEDLIDSPYSSSRKICYFFF